jgi:hypothetical protein
VQTCSRAIQTTDCNLVPYMRTACCITKTTDTNSEYVILIVFHFNMVTLASISIKFIRKLLLLKLKMVVHTVATRLPMVNILPLTNSNDSRSCSTHARTHTHMHKRVNYCTTQRKFCKQLTSAFQFLTACTDE